MDKTMWENEDYSKWQKAGYPIVNSIRMLSLSNVSNIPEKISNLTGLFYLTLSRSLSLTSLPDSIGNLNYLKSLVINNTGLTTLPYSIGNLTNLELLDLKKNKLNSLPDSIGNLTNLTQLELNHNNLEVLPDSIGNLIKLRSLELYDNELESLPDSIENLTNLTYLTFEFNRFTSLPNSIFKLTNLSSIYLKNNPYEFPIEIDKFKKFKNLNRVNILSKFNLGSEIKAANNNVILADPARKQDRAVNIAKMRPLQADQELAKAEGRSFETRSIPDTKYSYLPELPRDIISQFAYAYKPTKISNPIKYNHIIENSTINNDLEKGNMLEESSSSSSDAKGGKRSRKGRKTVRKARRTRRKTVRRKSKKSKTRRRNKK